MTPVGKLLRDSWVGRGVAVNPPAPSAAVEAFESKYQLRLPPDLRDYFLTVNGMLDGESDDDLLSFWPLESLVPAADEPELWPGVPDPSVCFAFADYFIVSNVFAIQLSRSDASTPIYVNDDPTPVAHSFAEFATLTLASSIPEILTRHYQSS